MEGILGPEKLMSATKIPKTLISLISQELLKMEN